MTSTTISRWTSTSPTITPGCFRQAPARPFEKDGVLFEQLVKIEDDSAIVWVAWDDMDRSGMRSYIDYREARKLGLVPFAL